MFSLENRSDIGEKIKQEIFLKRTKYKSLSVCARVNVR
jgi:hypothetical protein